MNERLRIDSGEGDMYLVVRFVFYRVIVVVVDVVFFIRGIRCFLLVSFWSWVGRCSFKRMMFISCYFII